MSVDFLLHALLGLLPVSCFLAALIYLDSYKLVSLRWILGTILIGGLLAGSSYFLHTFLLDVTRIEYTQYVRYVSPPLEEALKGLVIVVLLRINRIGFLVDAAIFGFATGAGFAMIENIYYLQSLSESHPGIWIVRGFGTAIMHGGATAILAVSYRALVREESRSHFLAFIPGLLVASVIHSMFNHFFFSPINNAVAVLIVLPAALAVVYRQSEQAVASWLDVGFDADTELLELINSGQFSTSKVGIYLMTLKEKFRGEVVADLLCYLRLHVELAIRAKGLLMMRESGFVSEVGEETRAKLEEMKYLENSIGTTGKLAIKPFLQMSRKDLWQFYVLSK
ncbi:MAG: PrsW family intramembrane metalloprotease [Gammaproteobacteria bacterium]|nr:PrsW family intramembrane metalloprotease [Gammaproteobacteria bacterium]